MEKKIVANQKKILLRKERTLVHELEMVARKKKSGKWKASFPDYGSGEDASISEFEDYDKNLSLEKNLGRSLKDIKKALKRIKKGRYGICDSCKKDIPMGRMKVNPSASLCVECKSKPSLLKRIWPFGNR